MSGELQALINKCAASSEAHYWAQKRLNDYCEERWGYAPSDIDCDTIIDSLYGGAGPGNKMTAKQFEIEMIAALEMKS